MEKSNQNKDFLQSAQWREFQQAVGRKNYFIENDAFSASIIEHILPIVGKYLYSPRGPVISNFEFRISNENLILNDKSSDNFKIFAPSLSSGQNSKFEIGISSLTDLAKKCNAGWIRIEPENDQALELIKENISEKIVKAPHNMQPKEIFVLDILKTAETLLCEMKTKTRYNIGIAVKKGIKIDYRSAGNDNQGEYVEAFLKLTKEMAERQGIVAHPDEYYRKMIATLPGEMLRIYVAKYDGKIIAANLVLFYGNTATYLHGASGSVHRNLMAPFSLQWQAILDAKEMGCTKYDFGGVKTQGENSWQGITTFKLGFSTSTKPIEFPGSYDIIINPRKYAVYRGLQAAKAFAVRFRK
ncbi:MAG: Methicillin resistance protein [Parcubacteria group bacterium GW2011_GWD2_38_11]|nr:MAG: Methicillin resistance protein [Parcubacteria group bacterium GW2011_GWD2_38_11]